MNPREVLRELGLQGGTRDQHFLVDERVLHRIVEYADPRGDETILEIGPGIGTLTSLLAQRSQQVYAIELDGFLADYLRDTMPPNVEVVEGDALEVPIPSFDKTVSNLPYSISSGITFRLLPMDFELGVLMYQLEFARRMVAGVGEEDYSRLSVTTQYYADVRILEQVPPSAFKPQPQVYSAIVEVRPRPHEYEVVDERLFMEVVTGAFTQRRKKLKNALIITRSRIGLSKKKLKEVLQRIPEDVTERRPERVSPEEYALIANEFHEYRRQNP